MIQLQFRIEKTPEAIVVETDFFEREDINIIEQQLAKILESSVVEALKDICKQIGWKVRIKTFNKPK